MRCRRRARTTRAPADEPDAQTCTPRADQHQRVARPGAEIGADVERRRGPISATPTSEQRDPHAERLVLEVGDRVDRRQPLDERCRRARAFATVPIPGLPAERPGDAEHDERRRRRSPSRTRAACDSRCPGSARPTARGRASTRGCRTIPSANRNRPNDEADRARDVRRRARRGCVRCTRGRTG